MARNDGGAAGSIIMSFVLGAFAGAAVALLMAPATGDEMRRKLAEKAREGAEKASRSGAAGTRVREQQRGTVVEAIERGREAYQQAKTAGVTPRDADGAATGRGGAVSEWAGVFLGIIAVATLVMALIQVGAIIAVLKIAKQAQDVAKQAQDVLDVGAS